jgi:carbonic anhydrase/acetyltransferase-like protein (isoleucine patch superfamily)
VILSHRGVVPAFGARVWVAENATIIGDVELGDDASVWFGCVLRGDVFPIRVGRRTNVQDGTVIHVTGGEFATRIGDDVTVGHLALLHGCTVGNGVLVGMGSVVLDGAVLEDGSLLGAGSLLPPAARVPAGKLAIGRPAKVIRDLTDEDRRRAADAGRLYLEYKDTFASGDVRPAEPRRL